MKTKQSTVVHRTSSDPESVDFPKPDPMELAKLGAILAPNRPPLFGLQEAMKFYYAAIGFARKLPSDPDVLFDNYASKKQKERRMLREWNEAFRIDRETNALRLDPHKASDEARHYLNEQANKAGMIGKKPWLLRDGRSVLDNLREFYESGWIPAKTPKHRVTGDQYVERVTGDQYVERMKRMDEADRPYYLVPRATLAGLVKFIQRRRSETHKRGATTRAKNRQQKSSVESTGHSAPQ